MRHAIIALTIAGCGGHSSGTTDGAVPGQALTLDDVARACENGYACLAPPIDNPTIPTCLGHLDDGDSIVSIYRPAQIRCLADAGANCAAARACVGYTYGACSPSGLHCDGDRRVDCSGGSGLSLNCRGGLWYTSDSTCVTGSSVDCGIGTCTDGAPSRCDGSRAVICQNGVLKAFDCAQLGETCSAAGGDAGCVAAGAACTASRCEGNQLVRCDGGHEQRYACDAMFHGGICASTGRDGASCAFGPDCSTPATCAGNVAQLCVLGAAVSFDCVAAGFAACNVGSCVTATFP
jgi:hypothetical protein